MREIKFRVWDQVARAMSPEFHLFGEFTLLGAVHAWQSEVRNEESYDSLGKLKDLIIMQYTGLKDKNGSEIYEGDILIGVCSSNESHLCDGIILEGLSGKEVVGTICYSSLYAQFYFTTDSVTYLDLSFGIMDYKVIGNIYEREQPTAQINKLLKQ